MIGWYQGVPRGPDLDDGELFGSFWNMTSNILVLDSGVGRKGISFCCPIKFNSGTWDGSFSRIRGQEPKVEEGTGGKFSVRG
ncbi:hypothetical protein PGTUg99_025795 [Puccinia graminis f. sp. tritici]|uniref:Uncharacterized protein n=1 Tax=Puccinia graminis f. sp. tritici TaxID=56615 RepID=A0A5B0LWF5_PUCGR|nr:hypothetical protein PGTUg99_025795 [Puccinia graminis f. sp. tritici]